MKNIRSFFQNINTSFFVFLVFLFFHQFPDIKIKLDGSGFIFLYKYILIELTDGQYSVFTGIRLRKTEPENRGILCRVLISAKVSGYADPCLFNRRPYLYQPVPFADIKVAFLCDRL